MNEMNQSLLSRPESSPYRAATAPHNSTTEQSRPSSPTRAAAREVAQACAGLAIGI
jgi:hypothetical protein